MIDSFSSVKCTVAVSGLMGELLDKTLLSPTQFCVEESRSHSGAERLFMFMFG